MGSNYDVDDYRAALNFVVRESIDDAPAEEAVQRFWYDYGASAGTLLTLEGQRLEVLSPGWWNHCAGPDFQGAQLRFDGALYHGDVEIHLDKPCWKQHGHHLDPRYDNVLLHVLLNSPDDEGALIRTSSGRRIPHLTLSSLCLLDDGALRPLQDSELQTNLIPRRHGSCNRFVAEGRPAVLSDFLRLSGDWRLLNKTRYVQGRIAMVGSDQATYELLARALGYKNFADDLERLACVLPYERALQLARQEPYLLEAALLTLAGLLPGTAGEGDYFPAHAQRLLNLREKHLGQLTPLELSWNLAGVRPNNYPGRRIAGLAAFIGRVARDGLTGSLDRLWKQHASSLNLRRAFEAFFPSAMGFWSTHFRLDRSAMTTVSSPVGAGRVRSIIGNVFVPVALACARDTGDRGWEDQILAFYRHLPMEPDNQIYQRMRPRVFGEHKQRFTYQTQQGFLQMHEDWCKTNPSCRDCSLLAYLEGQERTDAT